MRQFRHEFQVNAPIERVAEFHSSTEALKLLTPPPLFVNFNHIEPMGEGSRADFTLWFGPIPINWIANHTDVHPTDGFTDTQVEGPFQTWIHRHIFTQLTTDITKIIDEIEGQPSDHLFSGMVSRFLWLNLPILFSYRAQQTRRAVEGR